MTNTETAPPAKRWHELDALRAGAMLLGILLHAMLAHVPELAGLWPVSDSAQSETYSVLMAAIHGFRMPLFFMLSGFFTAMLWRKRGLKSLLGQRAKRILLPLVIGMFTVVPAVWITSIAASSATYEKQNEVDNLWASARNGDTTLLQKLIDGGAPLDAQDPTLGSSPLTVAAIYDRPEAAKLLLDAGADPDFINRDKGTAAHAAFFFGRAEVAKLLIDKGADLSIRDQSGATAIEAMGAGPDVTAFIAGVIQLEIDQEEVDTGREEIAAYLKDKNIAATPSDAPEATNQALKGLTDLATLFPLFHHLWFLWFLCWLVVAFAIYAVAADAVGFKGLPAWLVLTPTRFLWLLPLTMIPQSYMGLMFEGFGPDTSSGLIPLPHVLLYYAIFFGFGVLYYDTGDTERIGRNWMISLPIALLVVFPIGYEMVSHRFGFADTLLAPGWHRLASVFLQVLYAWMMTFGLMGLFRHFFSGESKRLRYMSDASYWLYLMHLPLVILLQIFTSALPLPAWLKIVLVTGIVTGVLLATYQWFVRYTFIGKILNGPRTRPT
ncbi:MAG: acyltransferase family protein [Aureliella sp.]